MDPASSFIISLIIGEIFSKGIDFTEDNLKLSFKEKGLSKALDECDLKFKNFHKSEIPNYEKEIQTVFKERDLLVSLAKEYLTQNNTDIEKSLKQKFTQKACSELMISSYLVKKYLEEFYDLVFINETESIPDEYRAYINKMADAMHDAVHELKQKNLDQEKRISNLEKADTESKDGKKTPADFSSYYKEVERLFTAKKRGEYRNLVGEEPDKTSYIEAFITKEGEKISALSFLEKWVEGTEPGVILIHGEPGHGKTTLCNKASFEFYKGTFLKENAKNVLAVSLNTGKNPRIIEDGELKLENALVWGTAPKRTFSFEDCRGSLLFLDGFDEFIDEAKHANIENVCSFMDTVDDIAAKYAIHIVILSRTIAVSRDLEELGISFEHYKLSPISDEQQNDWFDQHNEYDDYRMAFNNLRNDENMKKLLEVPFLFRLIVNSRFETVTSNTVELYDDLFVHLMHKRNIYNEKIEVVKEGLMKLAFEIYCTDTYMAKIDWNPQWVFAFYVESVDGDRIGFFHRTFYQYFLAKYIYSGIINITDENVKNFIGSFAERELDDTVRQYLKLMYREEDESKIYPNIEKMIDALVRTEAYLNFTPHVESEYAQRSKILRSKNIYRNTLHIAAAALYVIEIPFKGNLDILVRTFDSDSIRLYSEENKYADLFEANLRRAFLRNADLSGANLSAADLTEADLCEADLSSSNLSAAGLSGANLFEAVLSGADLSGANLSKGNLSKADLSGAILLKAILERVNLSVACLNGAKLIGANLSNANLIRAHLREAYLIGADLRGADLRGADLNKARLCEANLKLAILCETDLSGANLSRADLSEADLRGADLSGANLSKADLSEANLKEARIDIEYKEVIDQSIDGYSSIIWVSDETPKLFCEACEAVCGFTP